jgi:hypothetical protein
MVDDLIVDDGVPSRGHRLCIYDSKFTMAGCFVGSHDVYSNMAAMQFTGGFDADEGKLAARLSSGPPQIAAPAGAGAKTTAHSLGACMGCGLAIRGGTVIGAAGGKWHGDCFNCATCSKPLSSEPSKKQEGLKIYCGECWAAEFAAKCTECGLPIAGAKTKTSKGEFHPECWSKVKAGGGAGTGAKPGSKSGSSTSSKTVTKKVVSKKKVAAFGGLGSMAGAASANQSMAGMYGGLK